MRARRRWTAIASLADHSLLTRADGRFGMLETVREYAAREARAGRRAGRGRDATRLRSSSWPTSRAAWPPPSSPRVAATASTPSTTTSVPRALRQRGGRGRHGACAGGAAVALLGDARTARARGASSSPARWRSAAAPRRPACGPRTGRASVAGDGRLRDRPRLLRGEPGAGPRDRRARTRGPHGQQPRHPRPLRAATSTRRQPLRGGDGARARARRRPHDQPDGAESRARLRRRRAARGGDRADGGEPRARPRRGRPRAPELHDARAGPHAARRRTTSARARCCAPAWRSAHSISDNNALAPCLGHRRGGQLAEDPRAGAQLWGAADQLRRDAGAIRQPDETAFAAQVESTLRRALGDEGFEAAVAEGAAMPIEQAVRQALAT